MNHRNERRFVPLEFFAFARGARLALLRLWSRFGFRLDFFGVVFRLFFRILGLVEFLGERLLDFFFLLELLFFLFGRAIDGIEVAFFFLRLLFIGVGFGAGLLRVRAVGRVGSLQDARLSVGRSLFLARVDFLDFRRYRRQTEGLKRQIPERAVRNDNQFREDDIEAIGVDVLRSEHDFAQSRAL